VTAARTLAAPLRRWAKRVLLASRNSYEALYEHHAQTHPEDLAVGGKGEFESMGRLELEILRLEGLQPHHTLLDLGCGTGRLAVQAIPYLVGGCYIGVDISPTMLAKATRRVADMGLDGRCAVSWVHQRTARFPQADAAVDMLCAFSVFTHMEHEDTFLYLKEARRIVRPGGRLVFSCLPLALEFSRRMFLREAEDEFRLRWSRVRTITTSVEAMDEIARMAGWTLVRWYPGDAPIPVQRPLAGSTVSTRASPSSI